MSKKYIECEVAKEQIRAHIIIGEPKTNVGLNLAVEAIDEVPAADVVEVTHGQWVKMKGMMPPEYHGHYECSECGWHPRRMRSTEDREEEFTYCPNCGAKMDGGKDK